MTLRAAASLALLSLVGSTAGAQAAPDDHGPRAAAFDLQDRRAQEVIWMIRCAGRTQELRQEGRFGPPDSVGKLGHCMSVGRTAIGVFMDVDTSNSVARRVVALDLRTASPYTQPLDTTELLARSRALRDALRRGYDGYVAVKRQFGPITIWPRGDSLQVWLIPVDALEGHALGGERGYLYSGDGRTLVREIDYFATYRAFQLPDTGTVQFASSEDEVPTVSELSLANVLSGSGRLVAIATTRWLSTLVAVGPTASWLQVPRR